MHLLPAALLGASLAGLSTQSVLRDAGRWVGGLAKRAGDPKATLQGHYDPDFMFERVDGISRFNRLPSENGKFNKITPSDMWLEVGPEEMEEKIKEFQRLNEVNPKKERWAMLIVTRHGEGWSNHKKTEWETANPGKTYWDDGPQAKVRGGLADDPKLISNGEAQARSIGALVAGIVKRFASLKPQAFFVSPLRRTLKTAALAYGHLAEFKEMFQERAYVYGDLREEVGSHLADHRSDAGEIEAYIKEMRKDGSVEKKLLDTTETGPFKFEPGFPREDDIWDWAANNGEGGGGETPADVRARANRFLGEGLFFNPDFDDVVVPVLVAHSNFIRFGLQPNILVPGSKSYNHGTTQFQQNDVGLAPGQAFILPLKATRVR